MKKICKHNYPSDLCGTCNPPAKEIGITDLLASLDAHIAHMAPHQKERQQGELMIRATAELRRLKAAIDETLDTNPHLADGHQCTLLGLKVALGFQPQKICRKCGGDGQVEIQSGPYYRPCDQCAGSGLANADVEPPRERNEA
jgi:hypothetical protein